jgi:hypothetical protein
MSEVAQENKIKKEDFIPLSPEERQRAKGVATEIWKESQKFIQKKQFQLLPGDINYARIALYGQEEIRADGEKGEDLVIELIPNDCDWNTGAPKPLSIESFHFSTINGGPVVKETGYFDSEVVEVHEADKEELEKLFKIIKNSRGVDEYKVPSRWEKF